MNTKISNRLLFVSLLLCSLVAVNAQAQEIEWAVAAQSMNEELATAVSADANYIYHAGDLDGRVIFGDGDRNETLVAGQNYVARYTHSGAVDWVAGILSDSFPLRITSMDSDPAGNVYIAGEVENGSVHTFGSGEPNEATLDSGFNATDAFIAKFSNTGAFEWVRSGGINEQNGARDIVVDKYGGSHTIGYYRTNIIFGAEGMTPAVELLSEGGELDNDLFIVKFDTHGDLVWARTAGSAIGSDTGLSIDLDHKNNIYAAGHIYRGGVFGKGTKAEKVVATQGQSDGFLARFTPTGRPIWVVTMGGASFDQASDLVNKKGKTVVVGTFNETATFGSTDGATQQLVEASFRNVFVARYNRAGELAWVNPIYQDNDFDGSRDVGYGEGSQSCVMGNHFDAATFGAGEANEVTLNSPGDADMYFACYSGNGVFQWVEPDPASLKAGTMTSDGEIIVAGGYQNNTFFGPLDPNDELLLNAGARDIFLAKYLSLPPEFGFTTEAKIQTDELKVEAQTSSFTLFGNYPNPFNPQTTIRFGLNSTAQVNLQVYDMTGRLVSTLVSGTLDAGNHEVTFEAADLPSGMYVYRLATPDAQVTRLMSLLK
ncbi:MAG: T9SS type A sorting domain-containing protein [Bacteroidota bacterium]